MASSGGTGEYPELWLKHQRPHLSKRQLAEYFKVPVSQVTLHCFYQGGSFGGWTQMALNMQPNIIAGILSKRTGRPVKWQFTRREDFCGAGIDNARYHVKVGFKKDGTITAVPEHPGSAERGLPIWVILWRTPGSAIYSRSRTAPC